MPTLSPEEELVLDTVRRFVDDEVRPAARELEHANEYPERLIERMKELGVFGLAVPEPWGEAPVSVPCYAMVTAELARGWMSLAGAMGGHTVVAKLLLAYGTQEQKDRYLPRMATGEVRATMALTEPGGGSDLQAMTTVAGWAQELAQRKTADVLAALGTVSSAADVMKAGLVLDWDGAGIISARARIVKRGAPLSRARRGRARCGGARR